MTLQEFITKFNINLNKQQLEAVQTAFSCTRKWKDYSFCIKLNCVTFIWGARGHFFWNGNKRTGLLLENKILISSGAGIMTIMDKYIEQFNSLLL